MVNLGCVQLMSGHRPRSKERKTQHSKDSEVTTNWRDQGRLLGEGGTCDEPLSTEMGLPDQGEEARLHGIGGWSVAETLGQ